MYVSCLAYIFPNLSISVQNQLKLTEARMMARNRNQLAQKTMSALSMMTDDTWMPFVVESLVQRMANMLNYVLSLLVGHKSRLLKVGSGLLCQCAHSHFSFVGKKCSGVKFQA